MYRIFIFEMFLELLCTNSERICHGLHSPDWSSKNSKKAAKWQIWIGKLAGALGHCFLKTLEEAFSIFFCALPGYACAQSSSTLCDPMDCSPPGSSVHGIFQARIQWFAISSSRGAYWPRDWTCVSCIGRGILYHCATSIQLGTHVYHTDHWWLHWHLSR